MTDRRRYQCHRDGCDSEALWQAKLHFQCRTLTQQRIPFDAMSSVKVCDIHKRAATEYILSDVNKRQITLELMREGLPPPDYNSARVDFLPIAKAEREAA